MAKKVYLVDTENVGSVWIKLLANLPKQDEIILFFTEHSPAVSYTDLISLLDHTDRFEFVKCYAGRNGLDFQLVTYLGYMLRNASKTEYLIVSNDYGFDSVVKFWCDRDRRVSRLTAAKINTEYNRRPSSPVKAISENVRQEEISVASTDDLEPAELMPIVLGEAVLFREEKSAVTPESESSVLIPEQETLTEETDFVQPAVPEIPETVVVIPESSETVAEEAVPEKTPRAKKTKRTAETVQSAVPDTEPKERKRASSRRKSKTSMVENTADAAETPDLSSEKSGDAKVLLTETLSSVIGTEEIDWAFDMLKKYDIGKDGLNVIYCEIIKHFAQEKGLNVYRRLKPVIGKFYSMTS